jgi:dUTP pyrophosphatase
MELPKGYEAVIVPRSSTFKKYGLLQNNSFGVIDGSYSGNEDEWKMPVLATRIATVPKGTRIAQFRIQLSQKATMWQKIKWLFSSHIVFKKVKSLDSSNRGGFGSTGN